MPFVTTSDCSQRGSPQRSDKRFPRASLNGPLVNRRAASGAGDLTRAFLVGRRSLGRSAGSYTRLTISQTARRVAPVDPNGRSEKKSGDTLGPELTDLRPYQIDGNPCICAGFIGVVDEFTYGRRCIVPC